MANVKQQVEFTKEQVEAMLQQAKTPDQLRAVKKLCKIVDPAKEQVKGSGKLIAYENKQGKTHPFVVTAAVELKDGQARGVFVRAEVARAVAEEILRVCDESGL